MRCYDGCPDEELQAVLDAKFEAHKQLADAGLRATYFPMEGQWMVFDTGFNPVTGFCDSVLEAADTALAKVKGV